MAARTRTLSKLQKKMWNKQISRNEAELSSCGSLQEHQDVFLIRAGQVRQIWRLQHFGCRWCGSQGLPHIQHRGQHPWQQLSFNSWSILAWAFCSTAWCTKYSCIYLHYFPIVPHAACCFLLPPLQPVTMPSCTAATLLRFSRTTRSSWATAGCDCPWDLR